MFPGPDTIYQCPQCDNCISVGSLMSGNTFGAKLYSDGKCVAGMMPEFPKITRCSKCKTIFWISKAKKIGQRGFVVTDILEGTIEDQKYQNAQTARFLSLQQYILALEIPIYTSFEEEFYIRKRLWWYSNDRVRDGKISTRLLWYFIDRLRDGKSLFIFGFNRRRLFENTNRLLVLLYATNDNEKVMLAELYRNLGHFEKCMDILNSIEDPEFNSIKAAFKKKCNDKNTKVFKLY